jgi:hypothetical protein
VFKVDNHCVALFVLVVSVSHECIIPNKPQLVKPTPKILSAVRSAANRA